ncbi:MAG: hypothetical protein ACQERB_07380 [Promethearchaeati archaeon]
MNSPNSEILDVCIIGDGFAGLNAARILAKSNLKLEIYTAGYGASELWVGTFDFLNYQEKNLLDAFTSFKKDIPTHPYCFLTYQEIETSFNDFFSTFPEFHEFIDNGHYSNEPVLTLIGNFKPCIAIWRSIFKDFDKFTPESRIILIDFYEFNNSAMDLVAKALNENYESDFKVLTLSFTQVLRNWKIDVNSANIDNLSDFRIGNYFDKNLKDLEKFTEHIIIELQKQYPEIQKEQVKFLLFPPILGIKNNFQILEKLKNLLDIECNELVAFSPSLMSRRFMEVFDDILKNNSIKINKRFQLSDLKINEDTEEKIWELSFRNAKNEIQIIKSKYVILAMGTLFQTGLFEEKQDFIKTFQNLGISVPNNLTEYFEIVYTKNEKRSNLFVCGAASHSFIRSLDEDFEIIYGTGLGLAVSTSYKISKHIIRHLKGN